MNYTGVFVFGDSLVDSGNALKLANFYSDLTFSDLPEGAPTASLGYFKGRFTDGYNFADLISNKYTGLVTKPVFPFGYEDPWLGVPVDPLASDPSGNNLNFAYGGSQIRQGNEAVPDLDGQTDAFKDAVDNDADSNALYLVTIGGNDVRSLVPSGSTPASAAEAHAALDAAAEKLLHELEQLIDIGVENILITGVPDVGLIPKYDLNGNRVLEGSELTRSIAATQYSQYLDYLIRTEVVPALIAQGANVTYVPLMDYVDQDGKHITGALNANLPTIAALHGLTTTELSQHLLEHQELLFFDQVHPTAQADALLAAYMYAQVNGTPWIETLPLAGSHLNYSLKGTISTAGEVDKIVVSLIAGTTYTFDMLGVSSLGTVGSLGDPSLRILAPGGSAVKADQDSGAGLDSTITFTATSTGLYTVELSATGSLTGSYVVDGGVVSGAAMLQGNTYNVTSSSTGVIEGVGGTGTDIVKTTVSYALSAGSEIEVLRTSKDLGTAAINLTGNEFAQQIVGNRGANKIDGKDGNDVLTGGAGKDTFLFTTAPDPTHNLDTIKDFKPIDDTISLSHSQFGGLAVGALSPGAFALSTSAQQADDRIIYDKATGFIYFDQDGAGTTSAPIHFATVIAGVNLTAADFIVG
jgi:phospholipase/lecithinase/hemolysin